MSCFSKIDQLEKELLDRDSIIQLLRDNIIVSLVRMKQHADKHCNEQEFTIGNWVFFRLQPYKQTSIKVQSSMKLSLQFFGPYTVLEVIDIVVYHLDLLVSSKIYLVFYISYFKKKLGEDDVVQHHWLDISSTSEI